MSARVLAGVAMAWAGLPAAARADVQDWQVSEVVTSVAGDPGIRYVELHNPVGGCLFPTSRIDVYGADGDLTGQVAPVIVTTCFDPDTYFWLATSAAVQTFDTPADHGVVPALPVDAGQVCFASSATRYDCVRWGPIAVPVADLFGPGDTSAATPPPSGQALARVDASHVVADDFAVLDPTPRGPSDGPPWTPPDAGPDPDGSPADGGEPDAGPGPGADAMTAADARDDRFLDLETAGGATCGCRVGGRDRSTFAHLALALLGLAQVTRLRRRRRPGGTTRRRPGCPGWRSGRGEVR